MTRRARSTRAIDWLFDDDAPDPAPPAPEIDAAPAIDAAAEPKRRTPRKRSVAELAAGAEIDAALERDRGYTKIPNALLDAILPRLAPIEAVVYLRLYRLTYGFRESVCVVSTAALARACHITERSVRTTLARLEDVRLVERLAPELADPNERGLRIRVRRVAGVAAPESISAPERSAAIKEKSSKESSQTPLAKLVEAVAREFERVFPGASETEIDAHLRTWAGEQGHDPREVAALRRRA